MQLSGSGGFIMYSGSILAATITNFGLGVIEIRAGVVQVSPGILSLEAGSGGLFMGTHGTLIHTNGLITLHDGATFDQVGHALQGPDGGAVISQGAQLVGTNITMTLLSGTFTASQSIQIGTGASTMNCSVVVGTNPYPAEFGNLYVTNATHTAYIDVNGLSNTLTLDGGFLEVDNLYLTNGGTFIDNGGTLVYTQPYQLANGATVAISGSAVTTSNNFTLGAATGGFATNTVVVNGGGALRHQQCHSWHWQRWCDLTNGSGTGVVTVTNATLSATIINLGSMTGGLGSLVVQSNALVTVGSMINAVSGSMLIPSSIIVTGGVLTATNGATRLGSTGSAQMTISNGTVTLQRLDPRLDQWFGHRAHSTCVPAT